MERQLLKKADEVELRKEHFNLLSKDIQKPI